MFNACVDLTDRFSISRKDQPLRREYLSPGCRSRARSDRYAKADEQSCSASRSASLGGGTRAGLRSSRRVRVDRRRRCRSTLLSRVPNRQTSSWQTHKVATWVPSTPSWEKRTLRGRDTPRASGRLAGSSTTPCALSSIWAVDYLSLRLLSTCPIVDCFLRFFKFAAGAVAAVPLVICTTARTPTKLTGHAR